MLDSRYRIDSLIAMGGMGAVYAGTHLLLHKRIAVKVLRTDLQSRQSMVERFQREAIAASAIGHENIVSVTDMGTTSDGIAYLVMELLTGQNLADLIEADAPLNAALACDITMEILSGIAAAHHAGIVHRDLKPENIFLSHRPLGRDRVKILDFGVSRLTSGTQPTPDVRLTTTGLIVGTPRYMSPEQARGETTLTHATDIYATGIILYEMLTKEVPYGAQNYNILVHKILSAETVPLTHYRPDLPPGLIDAVERAMALDPLDRYTTAEEFAIALAPFSSNPAAAPTLPLTLPRARKSTGGSAYKTENAATVVSDESGRYIPTAARRPPAESGPLGMFSDEAPEERRGGDGLAKWGGLVAVLAMVGGIAAFVLYSRKDSGDDEGVKPASAAAAAPAARPEAKAEREAPAPPPDPPAPEARPVKKPEVKPDKKPEARPDRKPEAKPDRKPKGKAITINFKVTPSDARITVDGETLAGHVYKTQATGAAASVVVTAPGYIPHASSVSLESNGTVKIKLKKTPQAVEEEPRPDPPPPEEPKPTPEPPP
ncbi:MAG TPA: serine/threonine-protein kinase [Kofleriaceae bacterium]|nr:serine/threonine-protein kinase [Kofleriaceae bacterium]